MSHNEFYASQKQTWLAEEVLRIRDHGFSTLADTAPSAIRKMRKAQLVEILVEWDNEGQKEQEPQPELAYPRDATDLESLVTEARQQGPLVMQDFKAFRAQQRGEVRRNLKKALCGCGQAKTQLENGTMQRHTRWNIVATAQEARTGAAPKRVRCEWSGKFPPAVRDMRQQTTFREYHAQQTGKPVEYTYKSVQTPDTRGPKTFADGNTRTRRRMGTKNSNRAKYGLRFRSAA